MYVFFENAQVLKSRLFEHALKSKNNRYFSILQILLMNKGLGLKYRTYIPVLQKKKSHPSTVSS